MNKAVYSVSGGRYSPIMSTLDTTWDDVSNTQQCYYIRKAKEAVVTALSVITPSQDALQLEVHWDTNGGSQRKCKRFDPNLGLVGSLVKVSQQAAHWQTKRQILSLFADNVS